MRKTDEELMKSLFHRYCGDVAEDLNKLGIHVDRNSALGGIIASLYEKENNKNIRSVEVKVEDKRRKKSDKELIKKLDERKKHDFVKKENRVHTKKSDKELIDRLNNRNDVKEDKELVTLRTMQNSENDVRKKITVFGVRDSEQKKFDEILFETDNYTIEYDFNTGTYTLSFKYFETTQYKTQFQFNDKVELLGNYIGFLIVTTVLDASGRRVSSYSDKDFYIYSIGYSEKENNYNVIFKKVTR